LENRESSRPSASQNLTTERRENKAEDFRFKRGCNREKFGGKNTGEELQREKKGRQLVDGGNGVGEGRARGGIGGSGEKRSVNLRNYSNRPGRIRNTAGRVGEEL